MKSGFNFKILTERKNRNENFFQITWEWEAEFYDFFLQEHACDYLDVQGISTESLSSIRLIQRKALRGFYCRFRGRYPKAIMPPEKSKKCLHFYFPMQVWHCNLFAKYRLIPIFLDTEEKTLDLIYKLTQNLPFYFVTALDMYNLIKDKYQATNIYYLPLSVADKWILPEVPQKTIDVVQIGRRSETLHAYMLRYCEIRPEVNYIYLDSKQSWQYVSTVSGNIGSLDTREDFMGLLQNAKVSLVSTPGVETTRFGSIDFFTPRFYESAVNYCRMVGVYTENEEAELLKIKSVCTNVKSYEEFEDIMNQSLGEISVAEKECFETFIHENCTSMRAKHVSDIVEKWMSK